MSARLLLRYCSFLALTLGLITSGHAEILIYRARLTSVTREADSGVKAGTPMPTGMALLIAFDLNTDFWEEPEGATEITVYENRGKKSHLVEFSESRSYTKFGYYAKGSKYFFFHGDFQESGSMDFGASQVQGAVRKNVVVGGKVGKASVPSDMVVTHVRGDGEIFKKFTFSGKYDQVLTVAVNNHLSEAGFQSAEGAGYSADIRRGMEWLANTYMPQNFKDPWPFTE